MMRRDALIALSLANVCFFRVWRELLDGKLAYYSRTSPAPHLMAVLLDVLLVGAIFFSGATLVRSIGKPAVTHAARFLFLLLVVANLRFGQLALVFRERFGWPGIALWFVLLALILLAVRRWQRPLARVASVLLLIASPFVLVTGTQGVWLLYQLQRMDFANAPAIQPPSPADPARPPRVLWLVLDEMDQRLAFAERPPSLPLPQFDRLRSQALYAPNAYPPGRMTELSMPALFTGKLVARTEPRGSDELLLWFGDEKGNVADQPRPWTAEPGIFARARNTALIGWYHPYCRVLRGLSQCAWQDGPLLLGAVRRDASVAQTMWDQAESTLDTWFGLARWRLLPARLRRERQEDIRDYQALFDAGKKAAIDPALDFLVIHLPVPHPIGFYDRARGEFRLDGAPGYLDNLVLADRTLGELRAAMEQAGLWERTTVIVTSDHWWRADFWRRQPGWTAEDEAAHAGRLDHRVPLLVRFPFQSSPLVFAKPVNTVLLHDLTLAILSGELRDAPAAARWLETRATFGESPYNTRK
ncbi:MAG TPA: sulfatase-like hydrolase/transferase [Terriglobales bacterium]|nr:sulfatase-like hydrolase/transferase [Terriglobales bacterium]